MEFSQGSISTSLCFWFVDLKNRGYIWKPTFILPFSLFWITGIRGLVCQYTMKFNHCTSILHLKFPLHKVDLAVKLKVVAYWTNQFFKLGLSWPMYCIVSNIEILFATELVSLAFDQSTLIGAVICMSLNESHQRH